MIKSSSSAKRVFQFRIELLDVAPTIWRRIQVPDSYSFWDLHVAIQDAMGWWDSHLHEFRLKRKHAQKPMYVGFPDDEDFGRATMPGWDTALGQELCEVGSMFEYEYDFGDGWIHEILHEGVLVREPAVSCPRCIDGARACPPEDCGGPLGFEDLLAVLSDPNHEDYESMKVWVGSDYDSEQFDPAAIKFDNPTIRLRNVLR